MMRPATRAWLSNAACLGVLVWLYGGDLRDALRARTAEVAAFAQPPSTVQPAVVLAVTAAALLVALYGLARRRGPQFRGYRLLPIVLVSALFLDLLFAESEVPVSSAGAASHALQHFAREAQALSRDGALPTEPAQLQPLLEQLGTPPYLVRGQPAPAYGLQVRTGCAGPVTQAPGAQVGTLLYCVAPGAHTAWVTLVGLPSEQRFGAAQVFSAAGRPRFVTLQPTQPAPGERAAPPQPAQGPGAFREQVQAKDAGVLPPPAP